LIFRFALSSAHYGAIISGVAMFHPFYLLKGDFVEKNIILYSF